MNIGSQRWLDLIVTGAEQFGVRIENKTVNQFSVYAHQLVLWNRKINLTAITDPYDIAVKHFLDSIIPSQYITPGESILDIGSGAGFPGIPIGILMPASPVVLIDPSRKKVSFLNHIVRLLRLTNVSIFQLRAEDMPAREHSHRTFDTVISRALFSVDKMVAKALPLLNENAKVISMKGKIKSKDTEVERATGILDEWKQRHANVRYAVSVDTYRLPPSGDERSICLFHLKTC